MKPITEELSRYKSVYAASAATGVKATQLHRLIDKGALVEPDGTIWIKSKTKLKMKGEK